ncbi:MAG: peptide chain release factor N(5)-glutamine methyltransferase [Candidatus Pacebacteria bacterium]|nr:peptide chain release factor N(5)-glutamine methyltransferase [Candidatus Paceibacterota bacterium]
MIDFLGCKIDVSKKVFIPRPETEYWTKVAIDEIKKRKGNIKVLDIFAGTGCVGIAVLKHTKNTFVDFVDISDEALDQILKNLALNKIPPQRYKIIKSNIFKNLSQKKYDFILANPPYVALERIKEVDKEVLEKEPHIALFGGKKGLKYIKKFLKKAKNYLKPSGIIYMEFDHRQIEEIRKILIKKEYQFEFFKDQFKNWRFLKAWV